MKFKFTVEFEVEAKDERLAWFKLEDTLRYGTEETAHSIPQSGVKITAVQMENYDETKP